MSLLPKQAFKGKFTRKNVLGKQDPRFSGGHKFDSLCLRLCLYNWGGKIKSPEGSCGGPFWLMLQQLWQISAVFDADAPCL